MGGEGELGVGGRDERRRPRAPSAACGATAAENSERAATPLLLSASQRLHAGRRTLWAPARAGPRAWVHRCSVTAPHPHLGVHRVISFFPDPSASSCRELAIVRPLAPASCRLQQAA